MREKLHVRGRRGFFLGNLSWCGLSPTAAILEVAPLEAYLIWQFTDSWLPYIEEDYPERHEGNDRSPHAPMEGLPDTLEYDLPNWDAIVAAAKASIAGRFKEEREQYHLTSKDLARDFARLGAETLEFIEAVSNLSSSVPRRFRQRNCA
ncbi:MAG: hypothetical protein ACXWZE_13000 [Candidatus Binatia bacterium]